MYDRTLLIATARDKGDANARQTATRLGIDVSAAYRLWRGTHAPSITTAAAVNEHYGLSIGQLIKPAAVAA